MTDLLRFLLLLRGGSHGRAKGEDTARDGGAITTRSLLSSLSLVSLAG
jgi:hypothetical protein